MKITPTTTIQSFFLSILLLWNHSAYSQNTTRSDTLIPLYTADTLVALERGDSFVAQLHIDTFIPLTWAAPPKNPAAFTYVVQKPVKVGEYFPFMDSLVAQYDTLVPYPLTEHLIVRANPWIIDTLANTDYYIMMARDSFVYNQKQLLALRPNDTLYIPDTLWANEIIQKQKATVLDLNIPEFKLRIIEDSTVLHTFLVRVGRYQKKYLALAGRNVDLRTRPGKGKIIRINRDPMFINPSNGRRFKYTRRDDKRTTLMPLIPWIEPEINGHRYGHMIHPTTNPKTLGRAYSNGCVGLSEADSWRFYYYAPLGTKVHFRYDLTIKNEKGETIELKDIYHWKNKRR